MFSFRGSPTEAPTQSLESSHWLKSLTLATSYSARLGLARLDSTGLPTRSTGRAVESEQQASGAPLRAEQLSVAFVSGALLAVWATEIAAALVFSAELHESDPMTTGAAKLASAR